MTIFSKNEMERRAGNARKQMAALELDCIVATSYPATYYLSGAPIHTFGRPSATVLPLAGDPAIVESVLEREHTELQSWIQDLRCYWDYNVAPCYEDPIAPPASMVRLVTDVLSDRGVADGRIGIEGSHLPHALYQNLSDALPSADFVDVSDLLARLRMVLSGEELALIRAADAIADTGQEALIREVAPGRSAHQICAPVRAALTEALLDQHPDKPFVIHVGCGLESARKIAGHSEWNTWDVEARAEEGQLLETVISVWLWGYWGNVERAVALGEPRDEMRRPFEIMVEANEAAIAAIRPGIAVRDIDRATKDVFARHGYGTPTGSGCGRGIVSYEGNARELAMDLRLYSDVVLQPGMAFSLEPDLRAPGVGTFRHCNTVIVTEDGCEVDSRLPRGVIWV